ncbi:MAG: hypothetical protein ACYCVZ_13555 [Streptosporangiaceae bacterium]
MTEQGYPPSGSDPYGRAGWQRERGPVRSRPPEQSDVRYYDDRTGYDRQPYDDQPYDAEPYDGQPYDGQPASGAATGEPPATDDGQPPAAPERKRRSRAAATRRRRLKRRLVVVGTVVAVAAVVAGLVLLGNRKSPARSAFITTFQKGELRTVPNACHVVGTTALAAYLAGQRTSVIQPINSALQSQCTYQRDAKPVFRVLNLTVQAYQPYLDAPGNGSATDYAVYAFAQQRGQLARPSKHGPLPPASIKPLGGLGNAAFTAVQTSTGSYASNRVTVVVRYRNVVVAVYLEAMVSPGFGPAPVGQLTTAAQAAARQLLAAVEAQPRAGR